MHFFLLSRSVGVETLCRDLASPASFQGLLPLALAKVVIFTPLNRQDTASSNIIIYVQSLERYKLLKKNFHSMGFFAAQREGKSCRHPPK